MIGAYKKNQLFLRKIRKNVCMKTSFFNKNITKLSTVVDKAVDNPMKGCIAYGN